MSITPGRYNSRGFLLAAGFIIAIVIGIIIGRVTSAAQDESGETHLPPAASVDTSSSETVSSATPSPSGTAASDACAHPSRQVRWNPIELDQAAGQLEETLDSLEQQQMMNYTSANICFVYEARLYILFDEYTSTLSAADCRTAIEEQQRWLSRRRAAIDSARAEYEGGTLAPLNGATEQITWSKKRIAELEQKLGRTGTPR